MNDMKTSNDENTDNKHIGEWESVKEPDDDSNNNSNRNRKSTVPPNHRR